jgi:hypothetical protein
VQNAHGHPLETGKWKNDSLSFVAIPAGEFFCHSGNLSEV